MFLELNYYEPSKQDKFPNWLLSQHLHIISFFSPQEVCANALLSMKLKRKVKSETIMAGQNHTGSNRVAASTYEAKQTE